MLPASLMDELDLVPLEALRGPRRSWPRGLLGRKALSGEGSALSSSRRLSSSAGASMMAGGPWASCWLLSAVPPPNDPCGGE